MPFLSVIIPLYNKEHFIIDTLKSTFIKLDNSIQQNNLEKSEIITLQNEGNWEYLSSNKYNEDFNKIIRLINSKI